MVEVTEDDLARAIYEARFAHEPARCVTKWEDLPGEVVAIWHRCARTAKAKGAAGMHGPFGHLVGMKGLNEEHWTIEQEPERLPDYFSVPLYAPQDPFALGRIGGGTP